MNFPHKTRCLLLLIITCGFIGGLRAQTEHPVVPETYHKRLAEAKQALLEKHRLYKPVFISQAYGDYDVSFYDLDLSFDITEERISGSVGIEGRINKTAVNSITLDLYNNLSVTEVNGVGDYLHKNDKLVLFLDSTLQNGEVFSVRVHYSGTPVSAGFQGLTFASHPDGPIISSLSEPYFARSWWPCKDIPSDKADSADISITVADSLIPVSNGTLKETTSHGDGMHTYHWEVRYPITTYLISVAISNYRHYSSSYIALDGGTMPLEYYIYPEEDTDFVHERIMETERMMEVFAGLFGEYPFLQEKYGMASFSWGGAMEHQTISSMGLYSRTIIAHELAHQWWGDWVTTENWHHIWLNEGFASYSEALYYEAVHGKEFYHQYMDQMAYRGDGTVYVQDTTNVRRIFSGNLSYDKGAYVLHMLRRVVGDSLFFDSLREYGKRYAYDTAVTGDYQAVVERVSGMDLFKFFEQWIYSSGVPQYEYCFWSDSTAGGYSVNFEINQTQDTRVSPVFAMPLDIRFSDDHGNSKTITVNSDEQSEQYAVPLPWKPTRMQLDPEGWVLKFASQVNVALDRGGCAPLNEFALAPNYPNPFNDETVILFAVPVADQVTGRIYNLRGELVRVLVNSRMEPGQYSYRWDGTNGAGQSLPSGVYLFQLRIGNLQVTQKMLFLK